MNITRCVRVLNRFTRVPFMLKTSKISSTILQNKQNSILSQRFVSKFSKSPDYVADSQLMDIAIFEPLCMETLEALTDYFDEVVEADEKLAKGDVAYSDGVLTIKLGNEHGTYVINRQTPNRQVWLSSPLSGPKRYDYVDGNWIYKHDGVSLHQLLQNELGKIFSSPVDFLSLANKKN